MHALHQVLHAFFNPHSFTLAMPDVWAGFQVNLQMMVIAEALVLVFALIVAIVRGLPGRGAKPLRALAIAYTDFFRGTPIIIVAFIVGFGLPGLQLGFISSRSFTVYGDHHADARLHGVRHRGVPGRHRVGAPEPALQPRARSASRTRRRCATSSFRRRCAA